MTWDDTCHGLPNTFKMFKFPSLKTQIDKTEVGVLDVKPVSIISKFFAITAFTFEGCFLYLLLRYL
jgi:hypothetical protein